MMNLSSYRIIQAIAIILGSLSLAFGQADLRVNEISTRLHIEPKGPELTLTLRLPVENLSSRTIPAHVLVELVDPQGKVRTRAEQDVTLSRPNLAGAKRWGNDLIPLPET